MCKIIIQIWETEFADPLQNFLPGWVSFNSGIDVAIPKTHESYEAKPEVPPTLRILIKRVKFSANSGKYPKFRLEVRKRADFLEIGWISRLGSWWPYSYILYDYFTHPSLTPNPPAAGRIHKNNFPRGPRILSPPYTHRIPGFQNHSIRRPLFLAVLEG